MAEKKIQSCLIHSKAGYPVTIKYGEDHVVVAPHARGIKFDDASLLDRAKLPKEIILTIPEGE